MLLNIFILSADGTLFETDDIMVFKSINIYFTVVNVLEMWIKLSSTGIKSYFTGGKFNIFDAFIVIISIADCVVS